MFKCRKLTRTKERANRKRKDTVRRPQAGWRKTSKEERGEV